ncbi:carbohydrate sulfotransferase 11-like [Uloborus diversus]|uniref:carbohydrate sulfotransferase 11-like n=1 Tax=Uloborus diversus TaxID=327109 RepID=UPI00240A5466|nr:carbohydrate sulfotransferase 11-like [Uloborus diversus]
MGSLLLHRCPRHRLLLVTVLCATFLCLAFVSFVDRWTPKNLHQRKPKKVNDPTSLRSEQLFSERQWESEYQRRVQRVRDVCEKDEIVAMRRVWRVAANRRFGKETHCKTRMCPIILDESKVLFFCFIPKVASTLVKRFFLNISGINLEPSLQDNDTALHLIANNQLRRISPMYYPSTTIHRFFKIIFVRHPFDRLVSAFRSKAEPPREEVRYFYDRYWDPIIKKLRPNNTNSPITFTEFVWYLTHVTERDFDEHWAPYWSRCDPCLVDYDFIGKLETAKHDFPYAFDKVEIRSEAAWWDNVQTTSRSLTLKYFATVPQDYIKKLYQIYRLDFELFGYTVDEFLIQNNTMAEK